MEGEVEGRERLSGGESVGPSADGLVRLRCTSSSARGWLSSY